MMPVVLNDIPSLLKARKKWLAKSSEKSLGFVPTMGALHLGHAELLKKARKENDFVLLSIFVNPTQFNDPKDLQKYPKDFESDLLLAKNCGVDYIFTPTFEQLYPDQYTYQVSEKKFTKELCGRTRPGHFDGVLTVVLKLLNLAQPTKAYFGEKDFQQLMLIQKMMEAFFMDVEIIPVPTVRDSNGLAMSSRNQLLDANKKIIAAKIHELSTRLTTTEEIQSQLTNLGFEVDYVEDLEVNKRKRRFIAAKLAGVRLIDNVEI